MNKQQHVIREDLTGDNPFLNKLEINSLLITKNGYDKEEESADRLSYKVEYDDYTKVFRGNGSVMNMYELNNRGRELLLYIIMHIGENDDWISINVENYMVKHKIKSINTYKDAVKNLVAKGYILRTHDYRNVFWVNPHYIFNGNRIKTFPKNVTIKREVKDKYIK
jgi:hypothetical protein